MSTLESGTREARHASKTTLPNLFIFGAPRCGTSSLLHHLRTHADFRFMDERDFKKIGGVDLGLPFNSPFLADAAGEDVARAYERAGSRHAGKVRYVFTRADYGMYFPHCMFNVAEQLPGVKLLIMLRNPVDRAYSTHTHKPVERRTRSFEEKLGFAADGTLPERRQRSWMIERGIYAPAVRRVWQIFPREDVHIIAFDDFVRDTAGTMRGVLEFLDLDPSHEFRELDVVKGASTKKGRMKPETRAALTAYYAPFNRDLFELLGWPADRWDGESRRA